MSVAARLRHLRPVLLSLAALGASSALAIYAVPLYELFCQVTGYGGTTQRADGAGATVLDREMRIRFDSSVNKDLPWRFAPVQRTQTVKIGKRMLAFYEAENLSDRAVTGTAVFNVTPHKAGPYFSKIECFCFSQQTLQPGETMQMPVSYFIDPAIAEDASLAHTSEITLSYTFFYDADAEETVASAAAVK